MIELHKLIKELIVERAKANMRYDFAAADAFALCIDKLNLLVNQQPHSEQQPPLQQADVMRAQSAAPLPEDAVEFIANALGEEVRLRQMIDLWCIDQFGNTEEAREKADAMFTAARDIFYRSSGNGA